MSHRFKAFSPPFCAKNRVRLVPPENSAEIYFDRALNRRSQDGVPRAFYVTFCTTQKVTIRSLCREHRGSANLDSARRNGGFARTKLNPFAASRQCPCRDGTLRVLFGYFLHDAKSDKPFSLAGSFEVFQTSIQLAQATISH